MGSLTKKCHTVHFVHVLEKRSDIHSIQSYDLISANNRKWVMGIALVWHEPNI